MLKVVSDIAVFVAFSGLAYLLAWSRLRSQRTRQPLYEMARLNPGIR